MSSRRFFALGSSVRPPEVNDPVLCVLVGFASGTPRTHLSHVMALRAPTLTAANGHSIRVTFQQSAVLSRSRDQRIAPWGQSGTRSGRRRS